MITHELNQIIYKILALQKLIEKERLFNTSVL